MSYNADTNKIKSTASTSAAYIPDDFVLNFSH